MRRPGTHGPSPFLLHGFLRALEESGSIDTGAKPSLLLQPGGRRRAGWLAVYLLAERAGQLLGAVPAFVKGHSYGEYIFDWGWASAAERAGIRYYPKLVIAAPHTPATGPRMLLAPGCDAAAVRAMLIAGIQKIADDTECSSIHWLFCTAEEQAVLAEAGYFARASLQFHWHNKGYASFDDFLSALKSRKRKQLKKERQRAKTAIDELRWVSGGEMTKAELDDLDEFYRHTTSEHGGRDYLRPGFFHKLAETMPDTMRVALVTSGGKRIAGALFLETARALYGRYWGATAHVDLLHFETAYYAGIERCIERKLPLFEAGAQGEHKLLRGFEPALCHSAHWIRHPGLAAAIDDFTAHERAGIAQEIEGLARYGPYRDDAPDDGGPDHD